MTRIPPAAWMLLFLLLVGVCAVACGPKVPPDLWASPIPPLPTVEHVTGERHADDCDVTPYAPDAPPLACSGLVVPEGLVTEWYAAGSEIEAWRASAEHQRASCERDRGYAEAAYGQEWQAHGQCRADLRAAKWAAVGTGIGGVVLGVLVGIGASAVVVP